MINTSQKKAFLELLFSELSNSEKSTKLILWAKGTTLSNEDVLKLIDEEIERLALIEKLQKTDLKLYLCRNMGLPELGLELLEKYKKLFSAQPNLNEYLIESATHKIFYHFKLGKKKKAVLVGDAIIDKMKNVEDKNVQLKLVEVYKNAGGIATASGDYEKCMQYYKQAISICERYHEQNTLVNLYSALGDIYRSQYEEKIALNYLELALDLCQKLDDRKNRPRILRNIGLCHAQLGNAEKGIGFVHQAVDLSAELNDYRLLPVSLVNLADMYIELNQPNETLIIVERIEKLSLYENDNEFKARIFYILAQAYFLTSEYKKALKFVSKFEKFNEKFDGFIDLNKAFELKIKILKALKKYKEATLYHEKLLALNQQIINTENKKVLNEFEAKFQNEKKEKEIQALKLESVSFQLQSLRAQMNPHFVFNTIGSISLGLEPKTIAKSKTLLNSFARLMRSNLEFAEQETISLEEEIIFINDYLLLEKNRLGNKLEFTINYPEDLDTEFIEIPSMILQPFIENSIKHGIMPLVNRNGRIEIDFKEIEDTLICTIIDNGVGRAIAAQNKNKTKTHMGKSTAINAKRLKLMHSKKPDSLQIIYTDLKNEKGLPTGTKVELILNQ